LSPKRSGWERRGTGAAIARSSPGITTALWGWLRGTRESQRAAVGVACSATAEEFGKTFLAAAKALEEKDQHRVAEDAGFTKSEKKSTTSTNDAGGKLRRVNQALIACPVDRVLPVKK